MSDADLPDLLSLSRRVIAGGELTRAEARQLFALEGEDLYDLFYAAHKVRRHFHGNRVTFCSILPTKFGNCSDRKSTRLNSSHVAISYAVFCLHKEQHGRRCRRPWREQCAGESEVTCTTCS